MISSVESLKSGMRLIGILALVPKLHWNRSVGEAQLGEQGIPKFNLGTRRKNRGVELGVAVIWLWFPVALQRARVMA